MGDQPDIYPGEWPSLESYIWVLCLSSLKQVTIYVWQEDGLILGVGVLNVLVWHACTGTIVWSPKHT